jgi:hypothetical protein
MLFAEHRRASRLYEARFVDDGSENGPSIYERSKVNLTEQAHYNGVRCQYRTALASIVLHTPSVTRSRGTVAVLHILIWGPIEWHKFSRGGNL